MAREVDVQSQVNTLSFSAKDVVALFESLDTFSEIQIPSGELSVVFLPEDNLTAMHTQFLNDPTPTDVITFPGDPNMDFAGEIFVSPEKAFLVSTEKCIDFSEELTLYLIHGWLHLAGYKDATEKEQLEMRSAENKTLEFLHSQQRVPTFKWA